MAAAEPFLRWAGGKRQLLPTLTAALPADFDLTRHRFFEPFVGGGAFMFSLADHPTAAGLTRRAGRRRPLVINDVNPDLTATYRTIQQRPDDLVDALRDLQQDTSEARYYDIRSREPADELERAARFIYLNKLGFNGLWRVNAKGQPNVPYGKIARTDICDEPLLRRAARWLAYADIRHGSYTAAVNDVGAGDVVYLDPPYLPLTPTASFSRYAKDDFREMDQWALAGLVRGLLDRGARVVLSNSNTERTRTIFAPTLTLYAVSAARSISAAAASRARVEEVVGIGHRPCDCSSPAVMAALAHA